MTALASTRKDTTTSFIKITKAKKIRENKWRKLYKKDKLFRLYTLNYDGWRYTIYGDDLASVDSELSLKWLHSNSEDKEADYYHRRFHELAEYLEKEGLIN